jgi:Protein of unknown function (DUF3089)
LVRKFLYFIAVMIVLVISAGIVYTLYGSELIRWVSVPSTPFVAPKPIAINAYARRDMWIAHPDSPGNPALWLPKGAVAPTKKGNAAVFFIHPTSFLNGDGWNATLDDADTASRAALFVRGQASVFNGVGDIWAPRYRQATFGAFLTEKPEAKMAIDAAYADVARAFDQFVEEAGDRPIILAGHSQGSLHLTRLIREKISGRPIQGRIVAAYVIGWPVSIEADLPALSMLGCARPDQKGCIISYQSFAEPAGGEDIIAAYDATLGFTGQPRKGTRILCTNPLTGAQGGDAPNTANLGTLKNKEDFSDGDLVPALVPARCDARGLLLIGMPPEMGPYVLPGNNYHVYDYSLFWANVRADVARRVVGKR